MQGSGAVGLWKRVATVSCSAAAVGAGAALAAGRTSIGAGLLLGCALGCADLYVMAQDIDRIGPETPGGPSGSGETSDRTRRGGQGGGGQGGRGAQGGEGAQGREGAKDGRKAGAARAAYSILVGRSFVRYMALAAGLAVAAFAPGVSLPAAAGGLLLVRLVLAVMGCTHEFGCDA